MNAMRKVLMFFASQSVMLIVFITVVPCAAYAIPMLKWSNVSKTRFSLVVSDGGVDESYKWEDSGISSEPIKSWEIVQITVLVKAGDKDKGTYDRVEVTTAFKHVEEKPHGGVGPEHHVADIANLGVNMLPYNSHSSTVQHKPHADRYMARLWWTSDVEDEQVISWRVEYKGVHAPVPEPSSIFLLSSGLVGLAVFVRKKFFNK